MVSLLFTPQEMKRQAGIQVSEEIDDYDDDDDDEDGSTAGNLQVFCCSAIEYQKMKNISTDDGPPQVSLFVGIGCAYRDQTWFFIH